MQLFSKNEEVAGYTIQSFLGVSGFSESYRVKARDGRMMKMEVCDLTAPPSTFFGEDGELVWLPVLRDLKHPCIPQPVSTEEASTGGRKLHLTVYDYIPSESLSAMAAREALVPTYSVLPVFLDLLEVLDHLHEREDPIVHNSISPHTVLHNLGEEGPQCILSGPDQMRRMSDPRGSVAVRKLSVFHAAPELLNGVFVPQSDIFSVGAVFYQMVMGSAPWVDGDLASRPFAEQKAMLEERRRERLSFALIGEDVLDEHMKNVLRKALAVDVADRFKSAKDFARALAREEAVEVVTKESGGKNTPVKPVRKEKEPGTGFDAIGGMESLKETLREEVILPIVESERFAKFGIPPLNGVLLYGPPGCGKTYIAERLAEEIGTSFMKVLPSDLASPFVHGGQEKIGELFKEAEASSPCVIFIEEMSAVVPKRDAAGVGHHYAAEVNEFLAQMTNCSRRGIFIVGATNHPSMIDEAILRTGRMDRLIYLPAPDFEARREIFRLELKDRPRDILMDYDELARLTEKFVSSDLQKIAVDAARIAMKSGTRISQIMVEDVIRASTPSVSKQVLEEFEGLHRKLSDERAGKDPDAKPSIGFTGGPKSK